MHFFCLLTTLVATSFLWHQTEAATVVSSSSNGALTLPSATNTINPIAFSMPSLTHEQMVQLGKQAAKAISLPALATFKKAFAEFAPDSWVEALNDIPLSTLRCLIREATVISLEQYQWGMEQMKMAATTAASNRVVARDQAGGDLDDGYYDTENQNASLPVSGAQSGNYTVEEIEQILRAKCRRGFAQILALNAAINETISQLPEHFTQILEDFGQRFKAMSSNQTKGVNMTTMKETLAELLGELKTVTTAERQQIANLFPKLEAIIMDRRIDQLLDLLINCTKGNDTIAAQMSVFKLVGDIWKDAKGGKSTASTMLAKTITSTMASMLNSRSKRQGNPPAAAAAAPANEFGLDMPDFNRESDDEPPVSMVLYSSNNDPLNLVQLDDGEAAAVAAAQAQQQAQQQAVGTGVVANEPVKQIAPIV